MVCHFVAPSARLASRSSCGTPRSACSASRIISGRLKTVSARAPEMALKLQPNAITKSARPNRPTTIEGTELISSCDSRIRLGMRPSPAYSAM